MLRKLPAVAVAVLSLTFTASAVATETGGGAVAGPPPVKGYVTSEGLAVAPASAPDEVKAIIAAGNRIAKKPYIYGGGHSSWRARGYDCSGSVSYALHGGHLLDSPMPSSGLMSWGSRGRGHWLTVFANSGHAYMTVAGLRFDTSMTAGGGPGWSGQMRSSAGYRVRHFHRL
jgi:hypothetical protein